MYNKLNFSKKLLATSVLATSLLFGTSAHAFDNIKPGVIDRDTPFIELKDFRDLLELPLQPFKKKPEKVEVSDPDKVLTKLKGISFKGNTVVKTARLNKIAKKYLNKSFTKGDLAMLKYEIEKHYYKKGYILVRVITPPQDVRDGKLDVEIYEARIGNIQLEDKKLLRPWISRALISKAKKGKIVQERDVETLINDFNDIGNVKAALKLSPGDKLSTTNLDVTLDKVREDQNFISADNYGSELTGEYVGQVHLEHSNFFKVGEKFNLDFRHSDDDLYSIAAGVRLYTGFRNLQLEFDVMHSENEIGDRLSALDASGDTERYNAALYLKFFNTLRHQATARLGFEARSHESYLFDVIDTEDDIRRAYLSMSYLYRRPWLLLYLQGKVSKGVDLFKATNKGDPLATNIFGDPEAWIFEPALLASFIIDFGLTEGHIKLTSMAQIASNQLLSSDLFTLGGYGSVRGFEPAQETGESGFQASVEYLQVLPGRVLPGKLKNRLTLKAGPFFDFGAVFNRAQAVTLDEKFYSAGLGLEAVAKIVPVGETRIRLDWAHTLGDYDSANIEDDSFYFSVKQMF